MSSQDQASHLCDVLQGYVRQIRFARAAELARSGRFLEAEGLLTLEGGPSANAGELDLLARISAQRRDFKRARDYWEAALAQNPHNTIYERAIERTQEVEQSRMGVRKYAAVLFAALVLGAVVVFGKFHRSARVANQVGVPTDQRQGPVTMSPPAASPVLSTIRSAPATPHSASAAPQPLPLPASLQPEEPQD